MRLGSALGLLFCGIILLSVLGRGATVANIEQQGYVGALKTTFLYTEAVKSTKLYGDNARAAALYKTIIELDSLHSPSYYKLAELYAGNDTKKAIEYTEHAYRLDTTNVWYQAQLGQLLVMGQQFDKAYPVFIKLVKSDPENPNNYRILAALHQQNGEPFSAIAVLDDAQARLGRVEELAEFKRQLLINVKLYDKALSESEEILREFPFVESNYVIMGQLYSAAKKDSSALATYQQGLNLFPNGVEILTAASDFYREKGDIPKFFNTSKKIFLLPEVSVTEKIDFFGTLTQNNDFYRANYFSINDLVLTLLMVYPKDEGVFDLQISHLLATGGIDQAVALLKAKLAEPKPELKFFNQVIDIETFLDHPDSAAKYSEMALLAYPKNGELYFRNGLSLYRLKKETEALSNYEKAIKYSDTVSFKSNVYLVIGDHYYKKNDLKKAFSYYDKALKLDPDNAGALNNYAYYLSVSTDDKKMLEKALQMSDRACTLQPSYATFLDTKGWALFKLGRFEEAKTVLRLAVSLDPRGSAEIFIHYGDILYELKEYFMASVYWKKSLESGHSAEDINERLEKIKGK